MDKKKQGLETLELWQKAMDYAVEDCLNFLPYLPAEEKWALNSQLRKSVQSIPANIAEGYGRYSFQETIHFCYIARGSMAKTKTFLILAHRLGYVDDKTSHIFLARLTELGKMLNGYINHLRNQKSINVLREDEEDLTYDVSSDSNT